MKEITYRKEGYYLKNNRLGLYSELILDGTLQEHLIDIDKKTNEQVMNIIYELAKKEKVDESMKQNNQLEWVKCMNNIKIFRTSRKIFLTYIYLFSKYFFASSSDISFIVSLQHLMPQSPQVQSINTLTIAPHFSHLTNFSILSPT